jgi:hypothetical protein
MEPMKTIIAAESLLIALGMAAIVSIAMAGCAGVISDKDHAIGWSMIRDGAWSTGQGQ